MKRGLFSVIVVLGLLAASSAFALDLHEARDAGILGEKADGYVAVLKKSPEAAALAKEVNQKRLEEYTRISKENDKPVDVVAAIAAETIIRGLKPGARYQDAEGDWNTVKAAVKE
jgi:uncharacterized protein